MPLAEAQSEWVADLLRGQGRAAVPDRDAPRDRELPRGPGQAVRAAKRHTIQVDFLEHLAELKKERAAGAKRV